MTMPRFAARIDPQNKGVRGAPFVQRVRVEKPQQKMSRPRRNMNLSRSAQRLAQIHRLRQAISVKRCFPRGMEKPADISRVRVVPKILRHRPQWKSSRAIVDTLPVGLTIERFDPKRLRVR